MHSIIITFRFPRMHAEASANLPHVLRRRQHRRRHVERVQLRTDRVLKQHRRNAPQNEKSLLKNRKNDQRKIRFTLFGARTATGATRLQLCTTAPFSAGRRTPPHGSHFEERGASVSATLVHLCLKMANKGVVCRGSGQRSSKQTSFKVIIIVLS